MLSFGFPCSRRPCATAGAALARSFAVIVCLGLARLAAAERDTASPAVQLPAFTVTETREGLPWKYAAIPGYEVLSLTSERQTEQVLGALWRSRSAVLPTSLQASPAAPTLVLLYDQPPDKETPTAIHHAPSAWMAEIWEKPNAQSIHGIVMLEDDDRPILCVNLWNFDFKFPLLWNEYPRLVRARTPRAPDWVEEGLIGRHGVYRSWVVRSTGLRIPKATWVSPEASKDTLWTKVANPALVPLRRIFEEPQPRADSSETQLHLWRSQAALFCRWALAAEDRAKASWPFVQRAAREPVDEAAFREAFGMSYSSAEWLMEKYLPHALREYIDRPIVSPPVPAFTWREATEAEVGRIKGHFEHVQGLQLRTVEPALSRRYLEAARKSFARARRLTPKPDTALLAACGLFEYDAGDHTKAREYLEAAVAANVISPSAYFRLAELRYEEASAHPAGAERKLSAAQLKAVLAPLFAIRTQEPRKAAVYRLIVRAWNQSATPPSPGHLAVLEEGLGWFPRDTALCADVATLYAAQGLFSRAVALLDQHLRFASPAEEREPLMQLRARLISRSTKPGE